MSIRIDLASDAIHQQEQLLREFPEVTDRHYRPVLKKDIDQLRGMIEPNIPLRTGRAMETFGSKVVGKGMSIKGEVGWYKKGAPFYIRFLEGGAKGHEIAPRGSRMTLTRYLAGTKGADVLRFPGGDQGGAFVFTHSVQHPGVSARGFMASAWMAAGPLVEYDLYVANEAIVKEMALS